MGNKKNEGQWRDSGNTVESPVGYGLKGYTEGDKERFSESDRVIIAASEDHVRRFIEDALAGKTPGKKMLLGRIGIDLSKRIQEKTGVNLLGYNLELRADEIRHARKQHGDEISEWARGQQAITAEDYANFPRIVTAFDSVKIGYDNGLHFVKDIGGRITAVMLFASGNKSLSLKTIYKGKKSGNAFQANNGR
ncbi:hypothetical protein R80B4_03304 [Fibrobacteres bacterium R8-0-B4]